MGLKPLLLVLVPAFIVALIPNPSVAEVGIDGSLSVTDVSYVDSLLDNHNDIYGTMRLSVRTDSGFRFFMNARQNAEILGGDETDLHLYTCYLSWSGYHSGNSVKLGRMMMFEGVARGFLDGLQVKFGDRNATTEIFGGTKPSDGISAGIPDSGDPFVFGIVHRFRPVTSMNVLFSSVFVPGNDPDAPPDMIGGLADWQVYSALSFSGDVDYDAQNNRMSRWSARVESDMSRLRTYVEYIYRAEPFIPESSFYSYFVDLLEPTSQVRTGMFYDLSSPDWLSVGVDWFREFNEGNSINLYLGITDALILGYRLDTSNDESDRSGFCGSLMYPIGRVATVSGGVDFSKYRISGSSENPAIGSYFRLGYDPSGPLFFSAEVQYVKDQTFDRDLRALVGAGYRFGKTFGTD